MKPITDFLKSKRLALEIRKADHADELFDLFCEKDLYQYICRDIPESKEWLRKGIERAESLLSDDGKEIWLGWVGKELSTGKPVGVFEITIINSEAFVAYTVFKPYWKKGFAVEATQTIMEFIKCNYETSRFVIEMDTRNWASIKVAQKLGFEFVKVQNNVSFVKNFVSHEFQFQKICSNN